MRFVILKFVALLFSCTSIYAAENISNPESLGNIKSISVRYPDMERKNLKELEKKLSELENRLNKNAIPYSLKDLISDAIINNLSLKITYKDIESSEWLTIAAKREWMPKIQFEIKNGYDYGNLFSRTYITDPTTQQASLLTDQRHIKYDLKQLNKNTYNNNSNVLFNGLVTWNILDFSRSPNINATLSTQKENGYLFDTALRKLIFDIQNDYYTLQGLLAKINQYKKLYLANKKMLEIIKDQADIGYATLLDVEQTKTQTLQQLSTILQYLREYISISSSLAKKLDIPGVTVVSTSDKLELSSPWLMPLNETIIKGKRDREETYRYIENARARKWSGISYLNTYLPKFAVGLTGRVNYTDGLNGSYQSSNQNNRFSMNKFDSSVYANLTWTFDGGINAANASSQFVLEQQALERAEESKYTITSEIISSVNSFQTLQLAYNVNLASFDAATKADMISRERYNVGVGEITSLIQVTSQLAAASNTLYDTIKDHNIAVARIHRESATWPFEDIIDLKKIKEDLK